MTNVTLELLYPPTDVNVCRAAAAIRQLQMRGFPRERQIWRERGSCQSNRLHISRSSESPLWPALRKTGLQRGTLLKIAAHSPDSVDDAVKDLIFGNDRDEHQVGGCGKDPVERVTVIPIHHSGLYADFVCYGDEL